MDFAKKETAEAGFDKLYLITDHTEFYEKSAGPFMESSKKMMAQAFVCMKQKPDFDFYYSVFFGIIKYYRKWR